jgi:flavin-dependent dehydrogenase
MVDEVDLLVLGAGPAGSSAAIVGARAGLRVLVLERSLFPRHRPGETLHPGVEPLLERLGARDAVLSANYIRHSGTWVAWGQPARFEPFGSDGAGPWLGFQAVRSDFDARLLAEAERAGLEVRHEVAVAEAVVDAAMVVGARWKQGEVRARFVVDAMGDRHRLARQLGSPMVRYSRPLQVRYGYATGHCPNRDDAPLIAADEHGWTWTACIGPLRYQWTRLDLRAGHPVTEWRPTEFTGLTDLGRVRGADVTWRMAERVAGGGYFLVGDAAAVLDPTSSHGVLRALMSGMMAGHLASQVVRDEMSDAVAVDHYQRWLTDWFRHDLTSMRRWYGELFGSAISAL